MVQVLITSPSLREDINVSGISSVTKFIIKYNTSCSYIHFELGKKDKDKGGINRISSNLKCLCLWMKMLEKYPEAIIHYNFPLSGPSILRDPIFMLMASFLKRKMVIHIHGGNYLTNVHTPKLFEWILRKVFSMNCPFIVLSESEKQILKRKYNCEYIQVLPNCVSLEEAELFERKISNTQRPLTLGYLGRIAEAKGMQELLDACIKLKENRIPFILRIAGKEENENQYLPLFEEKLSEQFIYEGVVSGIKKDDFLKKIDVFVLPSYYEGLPMSLLECMSFGSVPLVTNVGSIDNVIKDGVNGIFIKVKDVESIYDGVLRLHKDRMLLNTISARAKETIFQEFSPHLYIESLNCIYNKFLF